MFNSAAHGFNAYHTAAPVGRVGMGGQCDTNNWWWRNWWRLGPPAVPFASAWSRDS